MVTAHPHPRAPQQRGLAPLAARRGGGTSQARADTPRLPWLPQQPGALRSAQSRNSKGFSSVPLTLLIHQQRTLDWIQRGILGCPRFRPQSLRKKRQSRGPREPGTWKGISLSPACPPPPPAEPKAGAGSRKLRKDREVRRPHSGAVITGTCPSRPRLPLSLSHFFPCWKVPVP